MTDSIREKMENCNSLRFLDVQILEEKDDKKYTDFQSMHIYCEVITKYYIKTFDFFSILSRGKIILFLTPNLT